MQRLLPLGLTLLLTLLIAPVAAQEGGQPITPPSPDESLRLAGTTFPASLDPLFVRSVTESQFAPNLFLTLTRINPETGEPQPALARNWSISLDGLTWTFTLRDNVPWVRYDPGAGTFERVRRVTAGDVVYAVQRACSSADNGYYATDIFAPRIAGCADGQSAGDGTLAQVSAPDATTVTITLTQRTPYFDSLAALWTLAPIPQETVEGYGDRWTLPGTVMTSGPFALGEYAPDAEEPSLRLVANPLFPDDLRADGGVNRVEYVRAADTSTAFSFYQDGRVDRAPLPTGRRESLQSSDDFTGQIVESQLLSVFYLGFATDLPPFDDVHLRRAFAASVDRAAFIESIRNGRGQPIERFIPSEVALAPSADLGAVVGHDPEYARAQLAQSPYPECADLPTVDILTYEGAGGWAGFLVDSVSETLGCDEDAFNIQGVTYDQLRSAIDPDTPDEERPAIFSFGWGPDYNDASSYANVLACGPENYFGRQTCGPLDDLITQAGTTPDRDARAEAYRELTTRLFGQEGAFPMIPLFQLEAYEVVAPWVSGPYPEDARFGVTYYDAYSVDTAARADALDCTLVSSRSVNLRTGPGTDFNVAGTLEADTEREAVGQRQGVDGFTWYQLEASVWVREDVVEIQGACSALPQVSR